MPTQEAITQPSSTPNTVTQPSTTPKTAAPPETRPVEIVIEDGELETETDRVHTHGGHVRLHIRSDQLVVVEAGDHGLSWVVPAGGEAQIEFDARPKKVYELELRRRKGVLVLSVRD